MPIYSSCPNTHQSIFGWFHIIFSWSRGQKSTVFGYHLICSRGFYWGKAYPFRTVERVFRTPWNCENMFFHPGMLQITQASSISNYCCLQDQMIAIGYFHPPGSLPTLHGIQSQGLDGWFPHYCVTILWLMIPSFLGVVSYWMISKKVE